MDSAIMSGTVADAVKVFKGISDALINSLNKLVDWGIKISGADESDGVYSYDITTPDGNVARVKETPVMNKDDVFHIEVKAKKGGKTVKYRNIKVEDIESTISDAVKELFEEAVAKKGANSSKKLKVTLKRVCSSREESINLTAVQANYSACEALDDLTAVLSEDEFADTITATPTSYEIVDSGDSYDVNPIDCSPEIDSLAMFTSMLSAGYSLMYNIQCVHWNAKGNNFRELHETLDRYYYSMNYQIDKVAEWCVEFAGSAPHPTTLCVPVCDWGSVITNGFTLESGFDLIRNSICDYVSTLELYYCNLDHDIQSVVDEWIREWRYAANYIITRTLKS